MCAKIPTFSFLMLGIKSILKEKRVKYFKYSVCYWAVVEGGGRNTLGNEFLV